MKRIGINTGKIGSSKGKSQEEKQLREYALNNGISLRVARAMYNA